MHNIGFVFANRVASAGNSLNGTPLDGSKYIVVELNPNSSSE